jgi:DNA polymerase III subunit alpha
MIAFLLIALGLLIVFFVASQREPQKKEFDVSKYPFLNFKEIDKLDGSTIVNFNLSFDENPRGIPYYIVVDTETSGLPKRRNPDPKALQNWPRIIQFSYLVFDNEGILIKEACEYFKQPRPIPQDAVEIHGITDEICREKGVDAKDFLLDFYTLCKQAKYLIGHNVKFDYDIIEANLRRFKVSDDFYMEALCTMNISKQFIRIPTLRNSGLYKAPNLKELVGALFYPSGYSFSMTQHDAAYDAAYAARCFFEMKKRGWISA